MSKIRRLKNDMSLMYDVADVRNGFDYWYYKLLNYVLGMFTYDGLPDSLPAREIELNLIITGHAVVFENKNDLVCIRTELYGFDLYYHPIKAVFGNVKLLSKKLVFGENAEVIYNNYIRGNVLEDQIVDSGLSSFIKRYARMLADVESTINIRTVNSRMTAYAIASTQAMTEQVKAFYAQVEAGKRSVLTDQPFLEAFRNVDIAGKQDTEKVNDLLIARDKILATFFREIGVKFQQEQKKAQLTEDEVTADEQLLLINPKEMLQERQEGLERVNRHFGTNITVKINPAYDREMIRREGNTNDSADNRDFNE